MPKHRGFTLIELLVVVAILAILVVIVMVSLDPLRQFREAKNARRWSDVNSISTAIYRYVVENNTYPSGIDAQKRQIGTANTGCDTSCPGATSACINLQTSLSNYLPELPIDLSLGTAAQTGYAISKTPDTNVLTVTSCHAENNTQIYVMR